MLHEIHLNTMRSDQSEQRPVYLDHHATTPVDPRVAALMLEIMTERFGNSRSVDHRFGAAAANLVTGARDAVAALVGSEAEDVRFTSGATEAIRLALAWAADEVNGRPLRLLINRAEHRAVLDVAAHMARQGLAEIEWLDIDGHAQIDLNVLAAGLAREPDLLCVMAANNEVGTLYPVADMARLAADAGVAVMLDATQAAGRVDLAAADWQIDYCVLSAHKLYGPKGAGALVAPGASRMPVHLLGGHDGTENVPAIAGFGLAAELRQQERGSDEPRIACLRDLLQSTLQRLVPELVINGDQSARLSANLHVSVPGAENDAVTALLRDRVALSTGSACTSGAQEPSHVLRAMGLAEELQASALRISPGKFTTADEIDRAAVEIAAAIGHVRAQRSGH